ncbi:MULTISPECIES: helix-turn-helix domain-containing protein [Prochlorococcus]|uniref:helix-turn-helix domain-containing protein n=1 Tax=Prochlorococcus TaxID=1218 RepID=UPI00053380C4|nr:MULTISPECIES: helix-turn-helix transcriptional regulator [Prochlorococcus]KGG12935.1 hypothetical protein EV05_0608 [Prochlorococcus sp. MIT 0601]
MSDIENSQISEPLKDESLSLSEVGSSIKNSRESQNLSTKELAEMLKIGEEQLIAVEQGQAELLPEKVFVKAMIRRISEKLGIEVKLGDESPITNDSTKTEEVKKKESNIIDKKIVAVASITSLSILTLLLGISLPSIIINSFYSKEKTNPNPTTPSTELNNQSPFKLDSSLNPELTN